MWSSSSHVYKSNWNMFFDILWKVEKEWKLLKITFKCSFLVASLCNFCNFHLFYLLFNSPIVLTLSKNDSPVPLLINLLLYEVDENEKSGRVEKNELFTILPLSLKDNPPSQTHTTFLFQPKAKKQHNNISVIIIKCDSFSPLTFSPHFSLQQTTTNQQNRPFYYCWRKDEWNNKKKNEEKALSEVLLWVNFPPHIFTAIIIISFLIPTTLWKQLKLLKCSHSTTALFLMENKETQSSFILLFFFICQSYKQSHLTLEFFFNFTSLFFFIVVVIFLL